MITTMNINVEKIADLHMHVVPGIDDGARTIEESLEMLKMAQEQGICDVFCTSHNGYSKEDGMRYMRAFRALKSEAGSAGLSVRLHKGCEVLCAKEYVDDIIYGLDIGAFATLGNTRCVLTELYPDAGPSEAQRILGKLKRSGYTPIFAHIERCPKINCRAVKMYISLGAMIQVNAYSLVNEENEGIKRRARALLDEKCIHFIGSDAHRPDHRPPDISAGVQYILENTDEEYARAILYGNACELLSKNEEDVLNELYLAVSQYGLVTAVNSFFGKDAKMKMSFSVKVCETPIEQLDISVRTFNILVRNGVETYGDALDAINGKEDKYRGLTRGLNRLDDKLISDIKTKIVNYNYDMMTEEEKKRFLSEIIEMNTKG